MSPQARAKARVIETNETGFKTRRSSWCKLLRLEPAEIQQTIKFGPDFELDPSRYELRRAGRVLKLERIPMEILFLLLIERDRVVGRQEIAERIWGTAISLDADNSINGAIRKIRRVLRDDPEHARFIQTVTGRGYRFIAAVTADQLNTVNSGEPEVPKAEPDDIARVETAAADFADARLTPGSSAEVKVPVRPFLRRRFTAVVSAALLIAAVSILTFIWSKRTSQRESSRSPLRIAVLPFQNLTGEGSQEYFSDGITEEMITELGGLDPQHLAVIARTSVMHYKNSRAPLGQIARELDVQYLLEGSVRRNDKRVRITVQLSEGLKQTNVWAREYDRAPKDLLAIQSEIAREIADEIQITLKDRRLVTTATRPALSSRQYKAYDLYLKGRYLWSKRTKEALDGAVYCFKGAIDNDPQNARAYAGLADSYTILSGYGYAPTKMFMPQARTAALKALQLDDSLAEGHTSLALIAENYDWDWQTAEKEYRRAIQLNSNYATAHHWFAEFLAFQGRFEEALKESERARELDPMSSIIAADKGAIYYFSRQYERAISCFRAVLDVDPSAGRARLIIEAYVQQGRFKEALADIDEWQRASDGPWVWAFKAYVYGRSGNMMKARQALQNLKRSIRTSGLDPAPLFDIAYAGIGDKEKWLEWLQEACQQHSNLPTTFKVDPLYDPLRGDPRFQELLRGAGFEH